MSSPGLVSAFFNFALTDTDNFAYCSAPQRFKMPLLMLKAMTLNELLSLITVRWRFRASPKIA